MALSPAAALALDLPDWRPFAGPGLPVLSARPDDLHCLTQAIYYEAGREPADGQAAVAQVVLNRLHRPAFPKTVCGVVFQGPLRPAGGCQFTFTCDGSLGRAPDADHWRAAQDIAAKALAGQVAEGLGGALNYHAAWMTPAWSSSLVQVRRIGGHVFYRPPSPGEAPTGRIGALTRPGRKAAPEASQVVFTVWGLPVAVVTASAGAVAVR